MLSGSQVQIEIQHTYGRPNHNCTSNAVTGVGLPEGVEWFTGTARDTAYLGQPNHNCTSNAVTGEGLPEGVEWSQGQLEIQHT